MFHSVFTVTVWNWAQQMSHKTCFFMINCCTIDQIAQARLISLSASTMPYIWKVSRVWLNWSQICPCIPFPQQHLRSGLSSTLASKICFLIGLLASNLYHQSDLFTTQPAQNVHHHLNIFHDLPPVDYNTKSKHLNMSYKTFAVWL